LHLAHKAGKKLFAAVYRGNNIRSLSGEAASNVDFSEKQIIQRSFVGP